MSESEDAKKTVTTTTTTAVPVGSADDAGTVTAPRCLVVSIVILDAIALFFWIITFFLPPLGFVGLVCAIVASILSCIVPCQDASDEFRNSIKTVMNLHIAFCVIYILAIALAVAAAGTAGADIMAAAEPLVIVTVVFTFVCLILLIACLVVASMLLCKINAARKR
jgi:hypothetical protein